MEIHVFSDDRIHLFRYLMVLLSTSRIRGITRYSQTVPNERLPFITLAINVHTYIRVETDRATTQSGNGRDWRIAGARTQAARAANRRAEVARHGSRDPNDGRPIFLQSLPRRRSRIAGDASITRATF